jgi:hypothetical protein
MKTFGSAIATGMMVVTLACGGGTTDENSAARNDSSADMNRPASDAADQNRSSLTGCLLAGGEAGSYVLQLAVANAGAAGGGASNRPTDATWAPGATYRIESANNQDMSPYLNKMIAVEGPFNSNMAGTAGSSDKDRSSAENLHTIRADSFRIVAERCPAPAEGRK